MLLLLFSVLEKVGGGGGGEESIHTPLESRIEDESLKVYPHEGDSHSARREIGTMSDGGVSQDSH